MNAEKMTYFLKILSSFKNKNRCPQNSSFSDWHFSDYINPIWEKWIKRKKIYSAGKSEN